MTISALAGTIRGTVLAGTSSTLAPRRRPANWYSLSVSGTGVTAARIVPGSAPITAQAGRGSRLPCAFQRRGLFAPPPVGAPPQARPLRPPPPPAGDAEGV